MEFTTTQKGNVTVITLAGSLMGGPDATTLVGKINECIDDGKKSLVINLTHVQFINSSGLGLLINGVTTMKNAGGKLKIAGASPKIQNLFKITRLESMMEQYPTMEAAVKSFN